ncbi:MAG: DUF4360 domain-containing protein [Bdellovibrionaceae bacterium]|nr:DUF4360 domain-containing protein [Pseudobdellovibrionaceae bacterium]
MTNLLLVAVTALLVSEATMAQSGIRLGSPSYGGSGCPAGTASVTLSPSEDALSILFDAFSASAGSSTGKRVDRKSCNLSIPVTIPQGYSVAVIQTDYRGFNFVPSSGAYTRLNTEYFWAGIRGPMFSKLFTGPQNRDFTTSNGIIAESLVWTPCGASVNLRVNSSIMAQSNSRMEQTDIMVDSADITAGLVYHLQWRRCY